MKLNLPTVLSFTGGYVDTAGFLALNGLFTAHVTGNFVMIGAAVAHGSSGIIAKLLALPVFSIAIIIVRYVLLVIPATPRRTLLWMLILKLLFLAAGAIAAIHFGSFSDPDGWPLILTGMPLVIAMAVQDAAHRIHLTSVPPSTLMTGTTTQIMIEVANLLHGTPTESGDSIWPRLVLRLRAWLRLRGTLLYPVWSVVLCCAAPAGSAGLQHPSLGERIRLKLVIQAS